MASCRNSSSASVKSMDDTMCDDHTAAPRRAGARFARTQIEPSHATAIIAQSPVNTDASLASAPPRSLTANYQRSTPQPVRRTLFSRLFRLKSRDADESRAISLSAATSPSSHQSTPTNMAPTRPGMSTTASAHSLPDQDDSRCDQLDGTQAVSMPSYKPEGTQDSETTGAPSTRVLLDGAMVKLSSHKYWHAKATYFVLEEMLPSTLEARSRVWLKQFRKPPKTHKPIPKDLPLLAIELTEVDVVVDISDRYIKHGFELFHRSPSVTGSTTGPDEHTVLADGELNSLRLSVDDAAVHRTWMRVLGGAIARLIDQSKRHYPITPADVEFVHGTHKPFEPKAVSAIVGTSIPMKAATAKVRPMMSSKSSNSSEDEDEDEADGIQENQGQVLVADDGDECDRQNEMRTPEEPEIHCDCGDGGMSGPESSLSAISPGFSDAFASPNNQCSEDDKDYGRSSNQLDDQYEDDEEDQQQQQQDHSHSRRLSECYTRADFVDIAIATSNLTQVSPTKTASVASTPSPRPLHSSNAYEASAEQNEETLTSVAAALTATSLAAKDAADIATPPSSPPQRSSAKVPYGRQPYPHTSSASRKGCVSMLRPQVHSFNANGQVFTLDVRYRLLKSIGNGAYGAVIAASDTVDNSSVAVKKITNIFDDLVDAKRILREVRLLRHFHHKNITQLLDLSPPLSKKAFEDMYIITELMETDLHQVIYSMQPMSDDHVKYFLYQMLCALYHIHSAGVLHRDMKPSNILLNSNCDLKVCDFGLARGGMDADADAKRLAQPGELTEYVVTRWYRAPEIMLNCLQYTAAIDVWAVGCIFAEMLLREPLFPGNDYMHQLKLIIKFLGTPKQDDTSFIKNVKALRFLTKLSISKPKKWRDVFTSDDLNPLALDLLAQMLIFNPDKRISIEKALQHPYLATFYDPADITRAAPFAFAFDLPDDKLTKDALVELLCEDVACFHPALMQAMKQPPPLSTVPMPMLPRPPMVASANGGNRYFGTTASAS